MKNKNADGIPILKEAFGEIDEEYISEALELSSPRRKERTVNKKKLFIIPLAAAILLAALSVSAVAAVASLADSETAEKVILAAEDYIVMNADQSEKEDLGRAVISDLGYDREVMESEADFGFSGLRPIYNVSVKLGGYSYLLVMDAATKKVLSCERNADESWEEHVKEEREKRNSELPFEISDKPNPDSALGDLTADEAADILLDYLINDGCGFENYSLGSEINYLTDPATVYISLGHGGYIYHALIDTVSGEIVKYRAEEMTEDSSLKTEDYDKDYHLHVHADSREYISRIEAKKAVAAKVGINAYDEGYWIVCSMTKVPIAESGIKSFNGVSVSETGLEDIGEYYSCEVYSKSADGTKLEYLAFVDAKTGDVRSAFKSKGSLTEWERLKE